MRVKPIPPDSLAPELRQVHDEIASQVKQNQGQVKMLDENGALMGPFAPMLRYPQYGIPALTFLRSNDVHATLGRKLREVAILTVGGAFGARFLLYAHENLANVFGLSTSIIATLESGGRPEGLNDDEAIAHDVARSLVTGHVLPASTWEHSVHVLGKDAAAELIFLIAGYCLIATVLNGFDMPAPDIGN